MLPITFLLVLLTFPSVLFAAPTITGIAPPVGQAGDIVTITGAGFSGDPKQNIVKFGPNRGSGAGVHRRDIDGSGAERPAAWSDECDGEHWRSIPRKGAKQYTREAICHRSRWPKPIEWWLKACAGHEQ